MQAIDHVLETVLYVDDLDAAERFYGELLGLELDSRQDGLFAFFKCGPGMLLLFEPAGSRAPAATCRRMAPEGRATPASRSPRPTSTAGNGASSDAGVAIEQEMTWPRGGRSFYFRDPAGNSLELATPRIWGLPDVAAPA